MKYLIKQEVWDRLLIDSGRKDNPNYNQQRPAPQHIEYAPNHPPYIDLSKPPETDLVSLEFPHHWFQVGELEQVKENE